MPSIPTDAIHGALTVAASDDGWNAHLARPKAAQQFSPLLIQLGLELVRTGEDAVIEGAVVLPRHVIALRKRGLAMRACFLGWTTSNLEHCLKHGGPDNWFLHQTPKLQQRGVRDVEAFSRHIAHECTRNGLPYVDMSANNYRAQHRLALNLLLGN